MKNVHNFLNFSQALAAIASFLTAVGVLVLNWRKEKKQEGQQVIKNYQELYNTVRKERDRVVQQENEALRKELEEVNSEDINDFLSWLFYGGTFAAIVIFWNTSIVPFLQQKINMMKDECKRDNEQLLLDLAKAAVAGVEKEVSLSGDEQKQEAAIRVEKRLSVLGLTIDEQHILDVIEYAWRTLINNQKQK